MKFSNYLTQISGVSVYPIVSLIMFVAFFTLVTFWIFSINKEELQHIENLPLNDH